MSLSLVKIVLLASSCSFPTAPTLTAARLCLRRERSQQRQIAAKRAAKVVRMVKAAVNPVEANLVAAKRMVRRVVRVVVNRRVAKMERAERRIRIAS